MIRTVLVGTTKTIPTALKETGGVVRSTLYPTYAAGASGDYNSMLNKPSINGITLEGDISLEDIGVIEATTSDIDALFEKKEEL